MSNDNNDKFLLKIGIIGILILTIAIGGAFFLTSSEKTLPSGNNTMEDSDTNINNSDTNINNTSNTSNTNNDNFSSQNLTYVNVTLTSNNSIPDGWMVRGEETFGRTYTKNGEVKLKTLTEKFNSSQRAANEVRTMRKKAENLSNVKFIEKNVLENSEVSMYFQVYNNGTLISHDYLFTSNNTRTFMSFRSEDLGKEKRLQIIKEYKEKLQSK